MTGTICRRKARSVSSIPPLCFITSIIWDGTAASQTRSWTRLLLKTSQRSALSRALEEAKTQLSLYAKDKRFLEYPVLKKVAVVFVGTAPTLIKAC